MSAARKPAAARRARKCVLALFAVLFVAGLVLVADRGAAAWQRVDETGDPGWLQLRSDPLPAHWHDLRAGDVVTWHIEASLRDAERSTLALELEATGSLIDSGLRIAVDACTVEHVERACPADASTVVDEIALAELPIQADGRTWQLAELSADAPRYLLVTVSVPEMLDTDGLEGRVGVGLHATGLDDAAEPGEQPGPGRLTPTGGDLLALAVLGIGLLGLGAAALAGRRRRAGVDS